jgi:DNA topoisomerase IB
MDTSPHRVPGLVYVSDEEPGISRRRAGRGFNGSALTLAFRGKGGKQHTVELDDQRIRRIVRTCQEIPGQERFTLAFLKARARAATKRPKALRPRAKAA